MRRVFLAAQLLSAAAVAAHADPWCWNADEIHAEVSNDTLRIEHRSAYINACPEPITYDVFAGNATLFVEEMSQDPCDLECCANLDVTLDDVPPGPWVLRYRWFDREIWDWAEAFIQIEVPDVGQGFVPIVVDQNWSGCLDNVDVESSVEPSIDALRVVRNPASARVSFVAEMSAAGESTIRVFDVHGRLVDTPFVGVLPAGATPLEWSARARNRRVRGGTYFVVIEAHGRREAERFVILP